MGISKPTVSVEKLRRLAAIRLESSPVASMPGLSNPSAALAQVEQAGVSTHNRIAPAAPLSAKKTVSLLDQSYQLDPKIQVFLSAALPARGISTSFDMLIGRYRPAKVLQMILRRALDDYELLLRDGAFTTTTPVYCVEEPPVLVTTSRMISRRLVEIALAHFDPFGLESARAFGHMLATAALGVFFENEKNGVGEERRLGRLG
ncbi:VirC2 family conjugal transfer protein [Mesorhizobium sp. Cs1299R1N1]|uniref:VirC2 family conjugal transfer protein n=1 Tax=Mesorhizobium sp. Cs1299R1N1 TaxID=3015172 RepID=UPI00301DF0ED